MGKAGKAASGALGGAAAGAALGPLGALGGGLIGGLSGLFGDDSEEKAMQQLEESKRLYGNLNVPEFDKLDASKFQYDPTMATANTVSEDPALRSQQLGVLNRLSGLADTGLSDVDQAGFEKARQMAGQIAHSGNAAALQNAEARGVGGSGLEMAMREQANQDAAQRAQSAGVDQASEAAKQRALYEQAFGNAVSGVRNQDFAHNQSNAEILNQFNLANTGAKNQAAQYNIGNRQDALKYNNQMGQQTFGDQLQKTAGMAGQNQNMAQGYAAQNAANQSNTNANLGLGVQAIGALAGKKKPDAASPWPEKEQDYSSANGIN